MNVNWVDHLNLRIPEDGVDEFVALYRDALGFDTEHLDEYRAGETGFFYLRLTDESVFHVSPTDSFTPPDGDAFNHVALFVDEPRSTVRERLQESDAEIVEDVDSRLGATGRYPSVYFEDPFGYLVELKSSE
ncbi:VOC family protein [Halorussus limi]|uniref:VOC family protein n=1 Tax=Halorussus limi TaxID=2938695 RepID=A0A8U0HSD1_9EURY|nr:VOC family protein [Halorussus limi]UPV73606.1 VOC family protein [Halorussus limi]